MSTTTKAKTYFKLKSALKKIESELAELRAELLLAGSGRYGDYVVSVAENKRESLSLEKVRGTPIWLKIKPLLTINTYETLTVTKK